MASTFSGSQDHSRSLEKGFHCSSNADLSLCKYRPHPVRSRPQSVLNSNLEKQPEKSGRVLSWKTAAMQHSRPKGFAWKEATAPAEALAKYECILSSPSTFVQVRLSWWSLLHSHLALDIIFTPESLNDLFSCSWQATPWMQVSSLSPIPLSGSSWNTCHLPSPWLENFNQI